MHMQSNGEVAPYVLMWSPRKQHGEWEINVG